MKLAMITVTRNDDFRFDEWYRYYNEYKDDVYLHIIVDDASDSEYVKTIKDHFSNSVIIEREVNGGSNAAVNDGLRYALNNPDVDAIMVLDNDIKVKKGSLRNLYDYLYSDEKLGMVGPLVLKKDSDVIEDFGVTVGFLTSKFNYQGKRMNDLPENESMYVDVVPGGITMSKPSFYKTVGLQDESIFMYCDERDMCYRSKLAGIKEGVTATAVTWHQHQYSPHKGKKLKSEFLIFRNRTFLQKKYEGSSLALISSLYFFLVKTLFIIPYLFHKDKVFSYKQSISGLWAGLTGNLNNDNIWY